MKPHKLLLGLLVATSISAAEPIRLFDQTGHFHFNLDNIKMPNGIPTMGLFGLNYFADINPLFYGGIGGYGAVSGTQGGLFVLGFAGGLHKEFAPHWWEDANLYVGGGGGHTSIVGGGLMLRPSVGISYAFSWAQLGVHYSYITFPSSDIHSHQIGLDLDIPCDFYYVNSGNNDFFSNIELIPPTNKYLDVGHNEFGLILQAYKQKSGTLNTLHTIQDGTVGLIGTEIDHYMSDRFFAWIKASGAYRGMPNGYMDVLTGVGYRLPLSESGLALIPQFGVGAGGGGNADTGGGILVQPSLGVEVPLTHSFAVRAIGGYLWAPRGRFKAITATGEILYHLNLAEVSEQPKKLINKFFTVQNWRVHLLNQSYLRPQRTYGDLKTPANLIVIEINQLFSPTFFFSYQGASAYSGKHMGGYSSGMIGPGLQTPTFFNHHAQLFSELLLGVGGGGGLALEGGAIIEPVVGIHYTINQTYGLQASVSAVKALRSRLNTPAVNIGLTMRFGTANA